MLLPTITRPSTRYPEIILWRTRPCSTFSYELEKSSLPSLNRYVLHPFNRLGVVGLRDVGHDDADGLRPPGDRASGGQVR